MKKIISSVAEIPNNLTPYFSLKIGNFLHKQKDTKLWRKLNCLTPNNFILYMQQFNSKTVKLLKVVEEEEEEEEEEGTTDEEIIFQSLELHSLKIVTSLESWKVSNLKISHLIAYFKTQ